MVTINRLNLQVLWLLIYYQQSHAFMDSNENEIERTSARLAKLSPDRALPLLIEQLYSQLMAWRYTLINSLRPRGLKTMFRGQPFELLDHVPVNHCHVL